MMMQITSFGHLGNERGQFGFIVSYFLKIIVDVLSLKARNRQQEEKQRNSLHGFGGVDFLVE
jgi:hypothetical protein